MLIPDLSWQWKVTSGTSFWIKTKRRMAQEDIVA